MNNKSSSFFITILPASIWFSVFLVCPLIAVCIASFCERGIYGAVTFNGTFQNYLRVFDPIIVMPIVRSVLLAVVNTFICLTIAIPISFFIVLQQKKYRNLLLLFVILPFWANFLVRTYAWIVIFKQEGLLNQVLLTLGAIEQPLEILFTWKAVLIGLVYVYLPFMVLPVYSSVEKLDLRFLRAASDLGATASQIFFHIILPLIRPGIRTGCLFVLIMTLGDFVIADLLGGAKFSLIGNVIKTQYVTARDWPFGSALTVVIVFCALVLTKGILSFLFPPLPQEARR